MKDKILVAKWGYSMILSTWVRVIKESPKTLLVEELKSRNVTDEEMTKYRLTTPGFLQCYVMPTDELTRHNGQTQLPFRVYKRDGRISGVDSVWVGHPKSMSSHLLFVPWDGEPEHEDHCD